MADSYDYEVNRRPRRTWAAWLLVPVALMALVVPFMVDRSLEQASGPNPGNIAVIDYQGARWVPSGEPLAVADQQMVLKGTGRDGRPLYLVRAADRRAGGGGGGATAERRLPTSVLYAKIRDGLYQPLVPR